MTNSRVLIAGIGNIFLGDDAFGCEVARRLSRLDWPAGVEVRDYGIRGLDLAYALLDADQTAILIDATPQGGSPGTLYSMELDPADVGDVSPSLNAHAMDPLNVLRLVQALGGTRCRMLLVGCEPGEFGDEYDGRMSLSPPVEAAVEEAAAIVTSFVKDVLCSAESVAFPSGSERKGERS